MSDAQFAVLEAALSLLVFFQAAAFVVGWRRG